MLDIHSPRLQAFWDWVKNTFTPSYKVEIERYLSDASNYCDLEQRIKTLQRRGMI